MTMWTMEDTEGFTQDELDTLNRAAEIVMERTPDETELELYSITDALNNVWTGGQTAEELAEAALAQLGFTGKAA